MSRLKDQDIIPVDNDGSYGCLEAIEKSTCASWLRHFAEGERSKSFYVVDAFISY